MSQFVSVPIDRVTRLINHGPTVMVTTRSTDRKQRNIMTAAWSTLVEFDPPRLLVVINKESLTRELIDQTGVFGVCVPSVSIVDKVYGIGHVSGRDCDKFEKFGLDTVQSPMFDLPVVKTGCVAWLECKLIPEAGVEQRYDTCFAEVTSAAANPTMFYDDIWHFDGTHPQLHTIHHLGGGNFVVSGNPVQVNIE